MFLNLNIDTHRYDGYLYIDNREYEGPTVSRIQLAVNVSNLDEAIEFYSKFFKCEPAKVRTGYANFAIDDPPLKLVLIESEGVPGSLNHLGVEVFTTEEVTEATKYLSEVGFATRVENQTTCCFAVQDKVWVEDPDRTPWEVYTVLADAPAESARHGDGTCCAATEGAVVSPGACC
jgi:catechol 2,3-dioxygenase-like lactoylglutathione lyase family enzyme